MAKILEQFKKILSAEQLEKNEQLRSAGGTGPRPVAEANFEKKKEELQDIAEETIDRERKEFLGKKSFPELHALVLEGSLSLHEIVNLDHLDNPLKSVLLDADQLRKKLRMTKDELEVTRRERSLIQDENKELKREIVKLKRKPRHPRPGMI